MYDSESLSAKQVDAYLARLEQQTPSRCDLESLNRLIFAQLTHIPFDALDVWGAGLCPSLHLEDLCEKILTRGRGGYCFELNTLFRALLNSLGFHAWQTISCILNPDGTPREPAHNVILCDLDGRRYFLDVGYGGPVPYQALALQEGQQGDFLLEKRDDNWYLTRVTEREQRPLLCFREQLAEVRELIPLNFYISQSPDSHFRHLIHLSKRNADGSVWSLDGTEYKRHTPQGTTVCQIETIEALKALLREDFAMDPDTIPLKQQL